MLLVLAGCGAETSEPTPNSGTPLFVSDELPDGPSVHLRVPGGISSTFRLEVVGRALPDVYGLAFRLRLDPGELTRTALELGPGWSASALALAQEPTPGLLVVGLSERGQAEGYTAADEVLVALDFWRADGSATPLSFVTEQCAVAQVDGGELPAVAWIGGAIELR